MRLKIPSSISYASSWIIAIAILMSSKTTVWGENRNSEVKLFAVDLPEKTTSCPKDFETLTKNLLKDLPDYANRVLKRTQDEHFEVGIDTYIITAGRSQLEPLNLPQINYQQTDADTIEQVFFTTLERQYNKGKVIERETYHWLFVTMADEDWYLMTIFSRFGDATKNTPPTPPHESSDGIIGQAVNLWLRDCRESYLLSQL